MQVWKFIRLLSIQAFKIIFAALEFVFLRFCLLNFQISRVREGEREEAREKEEGKVVVREEGKGRMNRKGKREEKVVENRRNQYKVQNHQLWAAHYWLPDRITVLPELVSWQRCCSRIGGLEKTVAKLILLFYSFISQGSSKLLLLYWYSTHWGLIKHTGCKWKHFVMQEVH